MEFNSVFKGLNMSSANINFWRNIHRHDCTRLLLLNTQKTKHYVRVNGVQQRFQFDTSELQNCDMAARRTQTGYLLAPNEVCSPVAIFIFCSHVTGCWAIYFCSILHSTATKIRAHVSQGAQTIINGNS